MNSPTKDKSFDSTNTKILIISIVTSLVMTIVIILLHFYSRYLRRRQLQEIIQRRSAPYNVTTAVEEREESSFTPTAGLDPSTISSLPSFIYKATSEPVDCAVCLGNLVEDNVIKMLPNCKHEFHAECIDKWLESSISCPVCRTMAKPEKDEGKVKREESTVGEVNQIERETGSIGSSFRKLFSMGRSSRRIQSVGDIVDEISTEDLDLERQ